MDIFSTNIVFFLVSLIIAITIHEAMHAFTAHWLGDDTAHREGRITLNPLAHIDILTTVLLPVILVMFGLPPILAAKPVPFNPDRVRFDEFGAALVGLAGPFTNLVLAALTAGILRIVLPDPGSLTLLALMTFLYTNVGLFVFNMLPIPPLDGSRLVYALAPEPLQKAMYQLEMMGLMFLLPLLFILMPIIGPIITNVSDVIVRFLL
jgi:Zn-dependent protease